MVGMREGGGERGRSEGRRKGGKAGRRKKGRWDGGSANIKFGRNHTVRIYGVTRRRIALLSS